MPPAQTLARLLPKLRSAGITRVADITGLDRIGIPVAMSVRPASKSMSVQQGKGASLLAAKVSAIMESVESFCAEQDMVQAECRPCHGWRPQERLFPEALLRRPCQNDDPVAWIAGVDLQNGETVFVPEELVTMDFTSREKKPGLGWFASSSNGLAAGNTLAEATLHGLCEVMERAAVARWRSTPRAAKARLRIDPAELQDDNIATMLDRYAAAAITLQVWDVTFAGVPAFHCVIDDRNSAPPFLGRFTGSGCHPDRVVALSRAVSEAAQSRLTLIAGARDDLGPEYYAGIGWQPSIASLIAAAEDGPDQTTHPAGAQSIVTDTVDADLERVVACAAKASRERIVRVDLTHPALDEPCVRVIATGFA